MRNRFEEVPLPIRAVLHPHLRHLKNVDLRLLDILRKRRKRMMEQGDPGDVCTPVYFDNVVHFRDRANVFGDH